MPTELERRPVEKKSIFDLIIRGAFFLLIVSVPLFFSFQLTTYTLPKVVIAQFLVSVIFASWFLKMTMEGRFLVKRSILSYPIFVYFVISIFSLTYALSLPGGVTLLWQIFAYVMVYFIVIHHIREEQMETWVLVLSLVGITISGYGILQYFGIEPLLQGYLYIPNIPFSTLGHRNQVAQYLILLIPLSGIFSILSPSRVNPVRNSSGALNPAGIILKCNPAAGQRGIISNGVKKMVFGLATGMMIYHLFLTKSRGGFLGFILSFLFFLGILIYKWLERYSFFRRRRWFMLTFILFFPPLLMFAFLIFPTPLTLRVKHVNPIGYYIHSIDGSKIPANQPIRIEFDFKILQGNDEKPGYVNLYGEHTNSSPIYLNPEKKEGWNHVKREEIYFLTTPYAEDLKLRWVPGGKDSTLQLRNIAVRSKDGLNLIKDSFLNRLFSKLGVSEIDKALSGQARLYMYRNTIEMIKNKLFLGAGFGNFKYVYPRYRDRGEWALSGLNTRVEEAHNEYLQILSEVGIIGFLAFVWILLMIGRMSLWMIQKGDFDRKLFVALALTTGIFATLVQSLFDFNLQNPASGITFWMAVGFLEVIYQSARKGKSQEMHPPMVLSIRSKIWRGVIGFGVLACLTIGIFYSVRPVFGDYYLKWGRFYMEHKDWQGAFFNFEKARVFSPYHFDIYFHLGQTSEQLKDYDRAVQAYQQSVTLHPYFVEARNNLGAVYIKLGLIDEAIEEFKGSIEINPYHPGLHNNLGYLYSKRNLLRDAIEEYRKTLELDPENAEVHKNLGLLYFYKLKDYPKAQRYWEKYLWLNPHDSQNDLIRREIEGIKKRLHPSSAERN